MKSVRLSFAVLFTCIVFIFVGTAAAQTYTAHYNRGYAASQAGDLDTAILEYTKSIELNPNFKSAWYNRGYVYEKKGDHALAIADYSKAIELDPKFVSAYINRANAYDASGNIGLAILDYGKAIELDPRQDNAYFNRGFAYKRKGMLAEALADYNKSIEIKPTVAKVYYQRGNVYTADQKWELAIADFEKAIQLDPAFAHLHYANAWMYIHLNDNERAYQSAVRFLDTKGTTNDRSGWAVLAGYLALRRQAKENTAEAFAGRYPRENTPGVFPAKALDFLRGRLTEAELLAAAGDDKMKLTSAHAFIGELRLLTGKKDAALESFIWVKQNGVKNPAEYALALSEIDRLSRR